jgi:hypothetical protein
MTHKNFPYGVLRLDSKYSPNCFRASIWQRLLSNIYFIPTSFRSREDKEPCEACRQDLKATLEEYGLEVLGLVLTQPVAFWVVVDKTGTIPEEAVLDWLAIGK